MVLFHHFSIKEIVPYLNDGKTVLVMAQHGNSLRALVKHLDGINEATTTELNIPSGTPLINEVDDDL
jgi:2,3-bisphosphoglycerate-dependent phosphoglycerate mutase